MGNWHAMPGEGGRGAAGVGNCMATWHPLPSASAASTSVAWVGVGAVGWGKGE